MCVCACVCVCPGVSISDIIDKAGTFEIRHEQTLFCSLLAKSELIWVRHEKVKLFQSKQGLKRNTDMILISMFSIQLASSLRLPFKIVSKKFAFNIITFFLEEFIS